MKIETNLSQEELAKAWWGVAVSEKIEDIILEPITNRIDLLEKDVESYLDSIYDIDTKVNDTYGEVKLIRYKDLSNLRMTLTMVYILTVLNFIGVLLVLFQVRV